MGYKTLVTLDLPDVTDEQRETFYEVLKEEKWSKIKNLTTSWKVSFNDEVARDGVIRTVLNDLQKAKTKSKINKVEYAIQLDKQEIVISNL